MAKLWRIGIIGCGWAGEQHALALKSLSERAEIVALADAGAGVAERKAREWQVSYWTNDYRKLLLDCRLDAVSICLPHHLHATASIDAANAGLHVLVEKPLASTLAEADEMIAAAEKAGITLMVAENVRFELQYRKASEIIHSGVLGDVFLIRISREHQMHDYLRARLWFLSEPSGGIMYSGGVHDFELVRMLGGEIEQVYAVRAPKVLAEMEGDDTSVAIADLASGAKAVLTESFSIKTPYPGVHGTVHGSKGSLWFHGNELRLYTADQDGQPDLLEHIHVDAEGQRQARMAHQLDTFQAEMEHFLDCLDGKVKRPMTSGEEERKPLSAVLAAYRSMELGRPVALQELEG